MKNSEYWKLRFEQFEQAQNKRGTAAVAEIERQYREAQKQLEGQIARWYQRFADNNEITLAESRKYLKGTDLKEFKWDVQDYIKYGQDNALMGNWMKELENASAKYHISKLEALKIQIQQSLEVMFSKQFGTAAGAMGDIYKSGYYHTAYEIQKGFNIGWDIAGLNRPQIEKVLAKPWAADGKNFSERIWGNKEKLISEVHSELTRNIMLGADPQKAIDSLAKKMNTSKYNAGRLVMTEEAYFSTAAQKDCFEELGVEQYEIVATLDSHTSDICQSLDGKHFPMKDFQAGVTAPPFHVNCRSTTVPYFDENFGDIGERAARDKDGKTYYVPSDMKYSEWKAKFVDKSVESGIINIGVENSMNIEIDEFTPCLQDAKTGEILSTEFSKASKKELQKLRGWKFDWNHPNLNNSEIYKLTLENDSDNIQGMIALTKFERDKAVYVNIAESAPHNIGKEKRFVGVGGHLFAIAVQKSIDYGYNGFVFMDAKNFELVKHYQDTLGATLLGIPHEYRMYIDEEAAHRLLKEYTLKEEL